MGDKVLPIDRDESAQTEAEDSCFLADAFSGQCYAMPCQVRDETYVMVKGKWAYYYRAVEKFGKTHDFMLSEHRDEAAATAFAHSDVSGQPFQRHPDGHSGVPGQADASPLSLGF